MQDAAVVCGAERVGELGADAGPFGPRQVAVAGHPLAERPAGRELHHQVGVAVVGDSDEWTWTMLGCEDRAPRARRSRSKREAGPIVEGARQHLHRDQPVEVDLAGAVDDPEPAAPDDRDFVEPCQAQRLWHRVTSSTAANSGNLGVVTTPAPRAPY